MPLLEVEIVRYANDAMSHYRTEYEKRYGVEPLMHGAALSSGLTTFKDLIRKVGYERVCKMVTQYLKHDGENGWYKKMGHTLKTFSSNIEQISAMTKEVSKPMNLRMKVLSKCSTKGCEKSFYLELSESEFHKQNWIPCDECKKSGVLF